MEINLKTESAHSATPSGSTLSLGKEYSGSTLKSYAITIAILEAQRRPTRRAMLTKSKSIKTYGQIAPILLVPAIDAIKQGLSAQIGGKDVTMDHSDIDRIYVIVDGGTRHQAIEHINSTLKRGENPIDPRYLLVDIKSGVSIYDILQEANQSVVKWDKQTHTASLVSVMKGRGISTDKLDWVLSKKSKSCSEAAAYTWANVKSNSVPLKSDISKAHREDTIYNKISNCSRLQQGKELYEAWDKRFSGELIGLKVIPEFIADQIDLEIDVNSATLEQAKDRLISFIKWLSDDDVAELKAVKGNFAKKSVELAELLSESFADFKAETLSNQSNVESSKNE